MRIGLVAFVLAIACQKPAPPARAAAEFPYLEWSVAQAQRAMETGELSAEALTRAYLARIQTLNPTLRALISVAPDALARARARDAARRAGERGRLWGIPIVIKDNIAAAGLPTTAGSLALDPFDTPRDAAVVAAMREAGAVILGKANLSEWANYRGARSSSGFSTRGGQTRNPYVLDRSPCGSSSGSAVAVSANLAILALGTETDGSIVCPASANGVVGLKPTAGILSLDGIIPLSPTHDTAGPMARTVADVALAWGALRGDASGTPLAPLPLEGVRLAVVDSLPRFTAETRALYRRALSAARASGAILVPIEKLPKYDHEIEGEIFRHELAPALAAYLNEFVPSDGPKSLTDIIQFNREHANKELRWYGQEYLEAAAAASEAQSTDLEGQIARYRSAARRAIDDALARTDTRAILAPSSSPAWPIDLVNGDHFIGGSSGAAAAAGYPILSLPMGAVEGLPVGISLIGTSNSESELLRIGASLEALFNARRVPSLLPTMPLPGPIRP